MPFGLSKASVLGAAGSGGGSEGGTFEWIAGVTVSDSTTNSITFSSMEAATYRELSVRWSLIAGTTPDNVELRINGNASNDYYSNEWWTYNSTGSANGTSSAYELRTVWTAGSTSGYASPYAGIVNMSNVGGSNKYSVESLAYRSLDTSSGYGTFEYSTTLLNPSGVNYAISSLTLETSSQYFTSGDTFQLFGAKSSSD